MRPFPLIKVLSAALCALLVPLVGLYFCGFWMPNRPSPVQYPIRGVDVSRHQGLIDWNAVAESGVRFVYLKATEGGDFQDENFTVNLSGARQAGLLCGAYHFFSFKSPGLTQARNFINTVPRDACALPPAIDLEYTGNSTARPTAADFHEQFDAFLKALRAEYGREPLIYADDELSRDYLDGYAFPRRWVRAVLSRPGPGWMFWQFSERGKVPGIHGYVDMDVFDGSAADFNALAMDHSLISP